MGGAPTASVWFIPCSAETHLCSVKFTQIPSSLKKKKTIGGLVGQVTFAEVDSMSVIHIYYLLPNTFYTTHS